MRPPIPAGAVGRAAGERAASPARRPSRRRHDRAGRRRPPPPLGPGPRRLPVDDRRPRRDPSAVRRRGPRSRCSMRPASTRTVLVQTRLDLAETPRVPRDRGGHAVDRRRRRLGGPDEPGRRRRRSPRSARRPGRRPPGRDPPPGPRRAGPRLAAAPRRPAAGSPRSRRAGLAYDLLVRAARAARRRSRPSRALPGPPVRHRPPRQAADPRAARCRRGPSGSRRSAPLPNVCVQAVRPGHRGGLGDLDDRGPRARTSTGRSRCSGRIGCCSARTGRCRCSPRRTSGSSTTARTLLAGLSRRTSRPP